MSLLTNLIHYYKLDEASGDAIDAHGSVNLTDTNTVGAGTGKINGARDFEATNSERFLGNFTTYPTNLTISCWINAESFSGANLNWVAGFSNNGGAYSGMVEVSTTSKARAYAYDGGEKAAVGTTTLSTGTWYHLVGVFKSGSYLQIWVNGTKEQETACGTLYSSDNSYFSLSKYGGSDRTYYDGLIDEVGVWSRDLDSTEIGQLYNGGSGLSYDSFGGGAAPLAAVFCQNTNRIIRGFM